jgi:hypothetical protein
VEGTSGQRDIFPILRSVLVLGALLIAGALPAGVRACGMPLSARIPAEQALIVFANGREEIITSVHLQSDGPGAAVIFPVPGVPDVGVIDSQDLFTYLSEVTRPQERVEEQIVWGNRRNDELAGGAAPGSVNVLGRGIIGGYDVAQLKADDAGALQTWLDENGYNAPSGAEPILRAYIDEGWKFVAVKLAPNQEADGALTPLRMAFDSREIVYPMRLGALADRPLDVLLYVLADHRVELPGLDTLYAGAVAQLDRPPPAALAPLFRAPFLTKLRNPAVVPADLHADFVARPATTDAPFREVVVRTVYVSGWSRLALPILGLVLVLLASAVAFGIALGMRHRMRVIAGPDPEDE